jgi:hypothetical protein
MQQVQQMSTFAAIRDTLGTQKQPLPAHGGEGLVELRMEVIANGS